MQILTRVDALAKLRAEGLGETGLGVAKETREDQARIQSPINFLVYEFERAFIESRTTEDHIIFVDGIDVKPEDLELNKFILALRNFSSAAVYLNENIFSSMKGRKRIRFCLLLRPDIFDRLNMQNQAAKVSDNSVVLTWDTTYEHHRSSDIFVLSDRFLGNQSDESIPIGAAWDAYVDSKLYRGDTFGLKTNRSFVEFLRHSWFRPRDIIKSLSICQSKLGRSDIVSQVVFDKSRRDFSDYLFGEVKDFSRFYFSDNTFGLIEKFFTEARQFSSLSYDEFLRAHEIFLKKLKNKSNYSEIDEMILDPDDFLQILYSSNIICWREESSYGTMDHWAFRERTASQMEPKVGLYARYAVHYGLRRAFNINSGQVEGVRDSEGQVA